jgi:hypothetical protein
MAISAARWPSSRARLLDARRWLLASLRASHAPNQWGRGHFRQARGAVHARLSNNQARHDARKKRQEDGCCRHGGWWENDSITKRKRKILLDCVVEGMQDFDNNASFFFKEALLFLEAVIQFPT